MKKIESGNVARLVFVALLWLWVVGYVLTHAVLNFFTIFSLIASAIVVFVPLWRKYGPQ